MGLLAQEGASHRRALKLLLLPLLPRPPACAELGRDTNIHRGCAVQGSKNDYYNFLQTCWDGPSAPPPSIQLHKHLDGSAAAAAAAAASRRIYYNASVPLPLLMMLRAQSYLNF